MKVRHLIRLLFVTMFAMVAPTPLTAEAANSSSDPSLMRVASLSMGVAATSGSAVSTANPTEGSDAVMSWIHRHAHDFDIAPDAPARDLQWLDQTVEDAQLVGLGESTHGSSEQFQSKHRLVRRLVRHHGFRTLAFEDDFASGVLIDRYITTGQGDPRTLVDQMASPLWGTEEILATVSWLRQWNLAHKNKVRFLGSDLLQLRPLSFDDVTRYVSAHAPDQLVELEADLATLRPLDEQGHWQNPYRWYAGLSDTRKQALIPAAARVVALIEGVSGADSWRRQYAEQHARVILGWFRNQADTGFRAYREQFIADSLAWWRNLSGHKTVYWAANVHTASAPALTYRTPMAELSGTMAGGLLERRLGHRYVSIGTFFGAGSISSPGWNPTPQPIGAPRPGMLEATFHSAHDGNFSIVLRDTPARRPVQDWLASPHTMRVILPEYDGGQDGNDYTMTVHGLRDAFDAAIYLPVTTASRTY